MSLKKRFLVVICVVMLSAFCLSAVSLAADSPFDGYAVSLYGDGISSEVTYGAGYGVYGGVWSDFGYSMAISASVAGSTVTYTPERSYSLRTILIIVDPALTVVEMSHDMSVYTSRSDLFAATGWTADTALYLQTTPSAGRFQVSASDLPEDAVFLYGTISATNASFSVTLAAQTPLERTLESSKTFWQYSLVFGSSIISFMMSHTLVLIPLVMCLMVFLLGFVYVIVKKK